MANKKKSKNSKNKRCDECSMEENGVSGQHTCEENVQEHDDLLTESKEESPEEQKV